MMLRLITLRIFQVFVERECVLSRVFIGLILFYCCELVRDRCGYVYILLLTNQVLELEVKFYLCLYYLSCTVFCCFFGNFYLKIFFR